MTISIMEFLSMFTTERKAARRLEHAQRGGERIRLHGLLDWMESLVKQIDGKRIPHAGLAK